MRHHLQITSRKTFFLITLCLCLSTVVLAQEISGSISGTVKDTTGAAVKGATVTITDADKKIVNSYGVWVEKSMYGKKYMGAERSTFVIDGAGRISAIFRKVNPEEHVAILREALRTAAG